MASKNNPYITAGNAPSESRRAEQLLKEWSDYVRRIQAGVSKPELARPLVVGSSSVSEQVADEAMVKLLRLEMNNLDLHNRLLKIAKVVSDLKEKHPELHNETAHLEAILAESNAVDTSRPQVFPPYRKAD